MNQLFKRFPPDVDHGTRQMGNGVTQTSVGNSSFTTYGAGASIMGMRGRPGMVINGKTYNFKTSDRIDIRNGRMYVNGALYTESPAQTFTKSGVPDSRTVRCGNLTLRNGDVESWKLTGTVPADSDVAEIDWKDSDHDLELVLAGGSVDVNFSGSCDVEGAFHSITTNTVSGDLALKGKAKRLRTTAVNGDTRVIDSRVGTLHCKTVNGDTKIRNSTIKKDSAIETVNGDVDLFLKHPAIVQSSSRDIKKCTEGPKITITSVNGDVSFDYRAKRKRTTSANGEVSGAKRIKHT